MDNVKRTYTNRRFFVSWNARTLPVVAVPGLVVVIRGGVVLLGSAINKRWREWTR